MWLMFADGGPFILVAMAIFIGGLGALVVEYKLGDRTRFPGLDDGLGLGLLATGFTGTWLALRMVLSATARASDETVLILAMMGVAISVIPVLFTAVQATVFGLIAVVVQKTVASGVRETIRPAAALHGVTVGALTTLVLSVGAGAGFINAYFAGLARAGNAHSVLETMPVQLWIDSACALGLTSMAMSLLMVVMGLIGGARGYTSG